jgi:hypothetical protein
MQLSTMENDEKKSKWDDLARELGAEVRPEPAADPISHVSTRTESEEPPRRKLPTERPPTRPKAGPMSWDNLAADLGIEPPPPLPTPAATEIESGLEREAVRKRSVERPPRSPKSPPPRRSGDVSESHQRPRRPVRPPQEEPQESQLPQAAEPEAKPAAHGMGVSLWHKIFGSPDEQAERIAEISRPDDEPSREDRPRDLPPGRIGSGFEDEQGTDRSIDPDLKESWTEPLDEVPSRDEGDAANTVRPTDDEGEQRRRRGRRRGRGRGRGRGRQQGSEQGGSQPPADRIEGRSAGGRTSRPRRDDDRKIEDLKDDLDGGLEEIVLDDGESSDAELDVDAEQSVASGGRELPPGHRSIPSWEEAIGMIVETNLATRSERRRTSPSRGSGPSRGRARGGRLCKKS